MDLGVDVGGTFTDIVFWDGHAIRVGKTSTSSHDQSEAIVEGARELLGDHHDVRLLHGTTVATNALLERRGATTALVTDPQFEDVIEIARQTRPSLYDPFADRPEPLVPAALRFGIEPPSADDAAADETIGTLLKRCADQRATAIAICFLHSYRDSTSERRLRDLLATVTDMPISISSDVVREFREYERMSTTVINAFLVPEVRRYLDRLAERARRARLSTDIAVMRSSGGLIPLAEASELPASILLSGPAGGVVAAARLGERLGDERLISFDMGGTSTDVCRIEGSRPEVTYRREIDGLACQMPSVAVHTVGAGGGSIGWVDGGGALRTGPQSAGAMPGPACYDRGGTRPTVTDANLLLGRLDASAALAGSVKLRAELAELALGELGSQLGFTAAEAAHGMLAVVESHMAQAIRSVSVEQGADPRVATLVAFGGAGGLHATALARELEMQRVVIPPFAGVFSALGLLLSPPRTDSARTVNLGADETSALPRLADEIIESALARYRGRIGRPPDSLSVIVDIRYAGQAHETSVPYSPGEDWNALNDRFHEAHRRHNGFARQTDPVEVVTIRVEAIGSPAITWDDIPLHEPTGESTRGTRVVRTAERVAEIPVLWRPGIAPGHTVHGPAVIEEGESTTYLGAGETAVMHDTGALLITW